ncbi:unnamed protein product [Orchesella dallaii]|uniref:Uncharacterized protein n=1 Tax=Orchesella dallaii TaxID=48710 RepID=A0ABP1SAW9_9HEXA
MENQKSSSQNIQPTNNSASTHPAATVSPPVQGNVSTTAVNQNVAHPADHQLAEPSVSLPQLGDPQWRSAVMTKHLSITEANHALYCKVVNADIAVKDDIIKDQLKNLSALRKEIEVLKQQHEVTKADLERTTQNLSQVMTENVGLKETNKTLDGNLKKKERENQKITSEKRKLTQKLTSTESKVAELENQLKETTEKNEKDLEALKAEQLKKDSDNNTALENLRVKMEKKEGELIAAKQQIEGLKMSHDKLANENQYWQNLVENFRPSCDAFSANAEQLFKKFKNVPPNPELNEISSLPGSTDSELCSPSSPHETPSSSASEQKPENNKRSLECNDERDDLVDEVQPPKRKFNGGTSTPR